MDEYYALDGIDNQIVKTFEYEEPNHNIGDRICGICTKIIMTQKEHAYSCHSCLKTLCLACLSNELRHPINCTYVKKIVRKKIFESPNTWVYRPSLWSP